MILLVFSLWLAATSLQAALPPSIVPQEMAAGTWIYTSTRDSKKTSLDRKQINSLVELINAHAKPLPVPPSPGSPSKPTGPSPAVAPEWIVDIYSPDGKRLAQMQGMRLDWVIFNGFEVRDKKSVERIQDAIKMKRK